MRVDEKVFVVTGAGSGLGRALTLELTNRGAKVAAVDIREDALSQTKALAGIHVETFQLDITDIAAVATLPTRVINHFGQVDGLINNAGIIQKFVPITELSLEDSQRVMSVNFTGQLLMIKSFLPYLLSRPVATILDVSSMGAYAPVPGQSIYGASKAALAQLTDGLRSELLDTSVHVTLVYPGAMDTNIAENSGVAVASNATSTIKMKRTSPMTAAREIVDAIEKGRERIYIGQDARALNVLSRLSPKIARFMIGRRMRGLLR